jgi:tripartite-type tricarboxylate transporter receptor subunit TctC
MKESKSKSILLILVLVFSIGLFLGYDVRPSAGATKYPEKDIVCLIPARPGGGLDTVGRIAAQYIPKYFPKGVNVICQNVPAAGGRVAAFQVYDAKPNGYTIALFDPLTFVMTEALGEMGKNRKMMNLTWMWRASTNPYAMATSPQSPIQRVGDLKGRKIFASASKATLPGSVAVLQFLGAKPKIIIYGGGAPSCLAVMRGDVDIVTQVARTVIGQVKASGGRLIPLAVFTEKRLSTAPDVPTIKELGITIPEQIMPLLASDNVFVAPPGLPADVHEILNGAIEKAIQDPDFAEKVTRAGRTVAVLPPDKVKQRISNASQIMPQYLEAMKEATEAKK